MSTLRTSAASAALLVTVGLLAGCGTTSAATDAVSGGATAADPVTVVDGAGEEVVLEKGPAKKVVALEWAQAEILSSLGVELAGVADVAGYESWAGAAVPLEGDPADVGIRSEPSVEAIAELEPDLITGIDGSIPDAVRAQLEEVAPVLIFETADASDPLGTLSTAVDTLATAVGREDEGEALNQEFETALAESAERVEAAGRAGTPVVFTTPYADGSNITIRMHSPGSAAQAVLDGMGLTPAWTAEGDPAYGLSSSDVEGLTAIPGDGWFLYWANADQEDPVEGYLGDNAVWQSLPFVEAGQVAGVAEGIWMYGGPASMIAFTADIERALGVE